MADEQPMSANPFVTPFDIDGVGTGFLPAPLFNAQGQWAPGIMNASQSYGREASNYAKNMLSRRGAWDSSMAAPLLERSFRSGFQQAVPLFQQQQQVYGGIAGSLMGGMMNSPAPGAFDNIIGEGTFLGDLLSNPLGIGEDKFLGLF